MLFSLYNHSQPLWVWADGTSISPMNLNRRVDIQGRVEASIKGGRNNPERGTLQAQEQDPPKLGRGENLLE